jgi:hypothetical protein
VIQTSFGSTQHPIEYWGVPSKETEQPQHKANHSPPSRAEVKNEWNYTLTSYMCPNSVDTQPHLQYPKQGRITDTLWWYVTTKDTLYPPINTPHVQLSIHCLLSYILISITWSSHDATGHHYRQTLTTTSTCGFGGLVVSMLASGTQDRGFEPGQSRRIFRAKKFSAYLPLEGM